MLEVGKYEITCKLKSMRDANSNMEESQKNILVKWNTRKHQLVVEQTSLAVQRDMNK